MGKLEKKKKRKKQKADEKNVKEDEEELVGYLTFNAQPTADVVSGRSTNFRGHNYQVGVQTSEVISSPSTNFRGHIRPEYKLQRS